MTQFSILMSTPTLRSSCKNLLRCFTAIPTLAVLLVVPLSAQRGGGGGGARGGAVAGGARGGAVAARPGVGGGQVTTGHSPGGTAARPNPSRGFSRQPSMRPGHSHGSNSMLQSRRFSRNNSQNCWGWGCWGWGWASPWWGWGPGWGGDYDSSYDYDHNRDRDYDSDESADRENYQSAGMAPPWGPYGYPPYPYAPPSSNARRPAASEPQPGTPILPATLLVFRDRHVQEVQNYAIVGQTIWNFAPQHIEKISLNEIDVPATVKANSERGRSFRVPSTGRSANDTQPAQNNT